MLKIISKKISNRAADPSVNITANKYLEVDNDLVSTELPTEEDIFEEFLMAEGVLQQHVEATRRKQLFLCEREDRHLI